MTIPGKLGRYELLEVIGRGGMGIVYRAQDPCDGRQVAIKELTADPTLPVQALRDAVERFRREAVAASRLNHPNIVEVLDHGQEGDRHYLVMELLEGASLGAMLAEGRRFSPEEVGRIGQRICDALDCAHMAGVIHRDIKPDNVMIAPSGEPKLMDFGVARIRSGVPSMTTTGTMIGTIAYTSPEQLTDSRQVDGRADLFSLGVVLYELLSGHNPFDAGNLGGTIMRIMNEPPDPLQKHAPGVPSPLASAVMRALRKNPDDRYRRAAEMRLALEAIAREAAPAAPVTVSLPCRFCSTALPVGSRVCAGCGRSQTAPLLVTLPSAPAPSSAPGTALLPPRPIAPPSGPLSGPLRRPLPTPLPSQVVGLSVAAVIGGPGRGEGQFQQPRDLVLDAQQRLMVADTENGRIQIFDADGRFLRQIKPPPGSDVFRFPRTVALSPLNILYVADDLDFRVFKHDLSGRSLGVWSRQRAAEAKPPLPTKILVGARGILYISEPGARRVAAYDAQERPLELIGGEGQLASPGGLALGPDDDLHILDAATSSLYAYDRRRGLKMRLGTRGDGPADLNFPRAVAIDRFGFVFVADTLNHRIQVYDPTGAWRFGFGRKGSGPGTFSSPEGLAFGSDGRLYVADRGNHRIQVLSVDRL